LPPLLRTAAALALAAVLAACGGKDGRSSSAARRSNTADSAADTRVDARRKGGAANEAAGAALHAAAEHVGGRTWVVSGTWNAAGGLEVSVEDGRYVLYGPEAVAVKDGRFRVELKLPATDRPTALRAFIGDAAGRHQVVVPLRP
jgi:hypothetical protein